MAAQDFPDFFLGIPLGALVFAAGPLLTWVYARSLGAVVVHARIGWGPVVHRSAHALGLVEVREFPLTFRPAYLPRRETFGRDHRRIMGAALAAPVLLAAVLAVFLPGPADVTMGALVLVAVAYGASRVQPASGRRCITRVLVATSAERDPQLYDPSCADIDHATYALGRGDVEAAAPSIGRLRADARRWAFGSVLIADAHEIRGEYTSALECLAPIAEDGPPAARLEHARLWLLMAEVDPSTSEKAVSDARECLAGLPPSRTFRSARLRSVQALLRVTDGNPADARAYAARQLANAHHTATVADALCTRARIEAASGRLEQAERTLRRAHEFAPWYARVAIVRGLLGVEAVATLGDRPMGAPAPDRPDFDDPWSVTGR